MQDDGIYGKQDNLLYVSTNPERLLTLRISGTDAPIPLVDTQTQQTREIMRFWKPA